MGRKWNLHNRIFQYIIFALRMENFPNLDICLERSACKFQILLPFLHLEENARWASNEYVILHGARVFFRFFFFLMRVTGVEVLFLLVF